MGRRVTNFTRPQRIATRTLLALVAGVLLPVCYLASAMTLGAASAAGWLPPAAENVAEAYLVPVEWYVNESGLPGAEAFVADFEWWIEVLQL
jgi:hypothetical protein